MAQMQVRKGPGRKQETSNKKGAGVTGALKDWIGPWIGRSGDYFLSSFFSFLPSLFFS